jgi:hypothetical protein
MCPMASFPYNWRPEQKTNLSSVIAVFCSRIEFRKMKPARIKKAVGEEMPEIRQPKKEGVYKMSVTVNGLSIETSSFTSNRHTHAKETA